MSEKLTIRRYKAEDFDRLKQIKQAQGFNYTMPEMSQFSIGAVIANGHGPDTALFLRRTAEAYLLIDPALEPEEKWLRMRILDKEIPPLAKAQGMVEAYAMIPPELEERFQKRLFQLGWKKQFWPMYTRQIRS